MVDELGFGDEVGSAYRADRHFERRSYGSGVERFTPIDNTSSRDEFAAAQKLPGLVTCFPRLSTVLARLGHEKARWKFHWFGEFLAIEIPVR